MGFDAKFVQRDDTIDYTPSADVAAGDIVVQGDLVGIAKLDITSGCKGALALSGIFDVAKASATTFTAGGKVYWDATNELAVTVSTGNTLIGKATEAAVSGGATVRVALNK